MQVASLALVALAIAGFVAIAPTAGAAPATSSELTVKWVGDSSSAAVYQPARDEESPHYGEFNDLSITVAQTTGVVDQAIRVSVAGFAVGSGTRESPTQDSPAKNAMNYLQAMQCWGDPAAAGFRETCQWGGRYVENNGLGNSVLPDNTLRVSTKDVDPSRADPFDNPFRTVQGRSVAGKPKLIEGAVKYEILDYFNPATSNEVLSARVGIDGTGSFDFETQTADQAPQLGCGGVGQLRCWLVVVPRGTVFGGHGEECSSVRNPATEGEFYSYGDHNALQGGSPVNPRCDYWDNRVVIPLDFSAVGTSCQVGSAEQRVIGSQLMVGAMSSWQPDLCAKQKTTYNFSTNPDAIARKQLLEGTASVAFASLPLSPGELDTNDDRQVLADTKLSYAPVAISGVAIAFLAEFDSGRQTKLNLSPRLVAKLLTQSYPFQIPANSGDTPDKAIAHLPEKNRQYRYLNQDPEFQQLNPDNWQAFSQNPGVVLPGPAGADAIRQVWKWIIADADAAAFLSGTADPSGMTVNPYYLPAGHANANVPTFTEDGEFALINGERVLTPVGLANIDGTSLKLSESTLETFIKADKTQAPLKLQPGQKRRFDSIQFSPYTDNLLSGARLAFRADPNSKSVWDPTKLNSANEVGDWVSSGAQIPGQKFMLAITDTPSAARYGLDTAALVVPNSEVAVTPDDASFSASLSALQPTSVSTVLQVDPAKVPTAGYPLTIVTFSEVNLTRSTAAGRTAIANLISQITTSGQVQGTAPGQLPTGYFPITSAMGAQATASVAEIRAYVEPALPPLVTPPTNGSAQDPYEAGTGFDDAGNVADGAFDPTVEARAPDESEGLTEDGEVEPLARAGLALSLGLGLGGAVFSPLLVKRKGFL